MYLVAESPPINSRQGNVILSRTNQVERLRLGFPFTVIPEPLTMDYVNKIVQDSQKTKANGVMLAVGPDLFPYKIMELLWRVNLDRDFKRFCQALVFCSYLTTANGKWATGFVIEQNQTPGPAHPFSFSKEEIQALSGRYLDEPSRTIFINCNHRSGRPLNNYELFPSFVSLLGYLKAKSKMIDRGVNPDTASYTLKMTMAAYYTFQSTRHLYIDLLSKSDFNNEKESERFEKIVFAQMNQLDFYVDLLDQKDRLNLHALLPQEPEK